MFSKNLRFFLLNSFWFSMSYIALWNPVKNIWFSKLYIILRIMPTFQKMSFLLYFMMAVPSWGLLLYMVYLYSKDKTRTGKLNLIRAKKGAHTREKKISQWSRRERETALHCLIDWSLNKCISICYIASHPA